MRIGSPPDPIAVFPARHRSIGELRIWDDGDEATVAISDLTHGHFNPYNPELNQEEIDREVTAQVLEFLEDMFADKYLIWKSRRDGSGGWQHLDFTDDPIALDRDTEYYLWSGPFNKRDAD